MRALLMIPLLTVVLFLVTVPPACLLAELIEAAIDKLGRKTEKREPAPVEILS